MALTWSFESLETPIFSANEIASAVASADQMGLPAVSLTLKETGARLFDEFAAQKGYIFNLGSGILPTVPVASMDALFAAVRARRQ